MGRKRNQVDYSGFVSDEKFPQVVYGLKGIMVLFHCSKSTAWRYRHTILFDACSQNGNKIIVDTRKALELFGSVHPERFVESNER